MKSLYLRRISMSDQGTFGVLLDGHRPICLTIELPYRNNLRGISSIPSGCYSCKRDLKGKHKHYRIDDVPHRTNIEFHEGNTVDDLKGCIALGKAFGTLEGKLAVLHSEDAFKVFHRTLKDEEGFALIIEDCYLKEVI